MLSQTFGPFPAFPASDFIFSIMCYFYYDKCGSLSWLTAIFSHFCRAYLLTVEVLMPPGPADEIRIGSTENEGPEMRDQTCWTKSIRLTSDPAGLQTLKNLAMNGRLVEQRANERLTLRRASFRCYTRVWLYQL